MLFLAAEQFSLHVSAFISLSRRRAVRNGRSLRKLRTHGLKCGIPVLPFSTHFSRFLGISALCPEISAKEEKRPILAVFLLDSRPAGYTRISEALCKHKHTGHNHIGSIKVHPHSK